MCSCQIPTHKAELVHKLSYLFEWRPSEKNLRIAEGDKVGESHDILLLIGGEL